MKRWHYSIGAYSYGQPRVRYPESGHPLTIGRYCSIASNVQLLMGGNHRHDWVTTYPFAAMLDAFWCDLPLGDVNRPARSLSGGSVAELIAAALAARGVADEG